MNGTKTVVLVDDEETVREVALFMLMRQGYTVSAHGTGESALASIISQPPDVIVTDLRMPGMTGRDLLRAVHHKLNGSTPPVIIISATPDDADGIHTELPGVVRHVIPKPFTYQGLTDAVQNALAV